MSITRGGWRVSLRLLAGSIRWNAGEQVVVQIMLGDVQIVKEMAVIATLTIIK